MLSVQTRTQASVKRKVLQDMDTTMNPLVAAAAAKRAKKEKSNANSKRKNISEEDTSGGLLIVRALSTQPTPTTAKPPSKKFRADSQPPFSKPPSSSQQPLSRKPSSRLLDDDASLSDVDRERDVRAMEDETDLLRRKSRAFSLIDPSLRADSSGSTSNNSVFAFPPPKPKSKSKSTMDVDTQVPIAENETPQQLRNKRLREGAMAAIAEDQEEEERGRESGRRGSRGRSRSGHRRASSIGRGKRISTSYEQTGVISQPHNTVSEATFYKHIDPDLPEVERIRQLLIWCSLRATSSYNKPPQASTSSKPSEPPLPPLSSKAALVLKKAQEEFVKRVAEKEVDLTVHGRSSHLGTGTGTRENDQNVRNRLLKDRYSADIQRANSENEAWKKVSYEYDAYAKKLRLSLDKRKKALDALKAVRIPPPTSPSAKSKGKGKARESLAPDGDVDMDDEPQDDEEEPAWLTAFPQPHQLPPDFQEGAELARSILLRSTQRRKQKPPSTDIPTKRPRRSSSTAIQITTRSQEIEDELLAALPTLQFKLDMLHTHLNAARATTSVCERILDDRFRILNGVLDERMRGSSVPLPSPSEAGVLARYIPRPAPGSASALAKALHPSSSLASGSRTQSLPPPPPPSTSAVPSPHTLLRALTRVDAVRPPAQVSDAARRAVREVGRAGQGHQDRRVTVLPGMLGVGGPSGAGGGGGTGVPVTPRKGGAGMGVMGTPGRGRTPMREKTPGR